MVRVYEMALRTWSDWLEVHINRNKTRMFFVSMSPTHQRYVKLTQYITHEPYVIQKSRWFYLQFGF